MPSHAKALAKASCAKSPASKASCSTAPAIGDAALRPPGLRIQSQTPPRSTLDGLRLRVPLLKAARRPACSSTSASTPSPPRGLAKGLRVLDAHTNTGQWALRMALAGAASIHALDTSRSALDTAAENAQLNGAAERCTFENAPAEDVLARGDSYGLIVLDPPAFAKARPQAAKALIRYQALNRAALRALEPGGYLVSCSCSHFIAPGDLLEAIKRAAVAEQRTLQLLELRSASPDHPTLLAMPETAYLKCAVLRVM
jgi:16S rRNA G966 N2-methylase RsmD